MNFLLPIGNFFFTNLFFGRFSALKVIFDIIIILSCGVGGGLGVVILKFSSMPPVFGLFV